LDNKIDINEIMMELEKKIEKGLSEKQLTVTDISILIGEHLEKAKEKVLHDTGKLIKDKIPLNDENTCCECGRPLKKTKK
jgi:hypothetical protein